MNTTTTKLRSCLVALALLGTGLAFANPETSTGASRTQPIDVEREMANFEEPDTSEEDGGALTNDRYRIELLVFAYVNTGEENSEIWRNPPRPDFSALLHKVDNSSSGGNSPEPMHSPERVNSPEPIDSPEQNTYHFLNPEQEGLSQFRDILRKMAINGQYRTLQHLIWEQVVLPPEGNDLFYLQGGDSYPSYEQLLALIQQQEQNTFHSEPLSGQNEQQANLNNTLGMPELEGSLHIYRSRYLHIVPNLWFSEFALNDAGQCIFDANQPNALLSIEPLTYLPEPETDNSNTLQLARYSYTPLTNFSITQRRRLKNGEIHYLDHPRFGFLIVFNKIVEEETSEDQAITEEANSATTP